ncbi:MAG: tyrosine-type recombinase/integrase, partial [Trebonia sp.]
MGFVRGRVRNDGARRFQAIYTDLRGHQCSAGTFASAELATRAWQRAEDRVAEGRLNDTRRGRARFRRYVDERWLPNHQMEARTRENYVYYLARYIQPAFGSMRMAEIQPADVREWVAELARDGVSPRVIRSCFTILSAVFTTAFNDQISHLHPCRGVKTPPVPRKLRTIVTPEQFDLIYAAVENEVAQLLIELDIESGLRWGELTELRPIDIDLRTGVLTVRRVAVELVHRQRPGDAESRFVVKEYPKDRKQRRLKINPHITDRIGNHIAANRIGADELLFPLALLRSRPTAARGTIPTDLGLTEPNVAGHRYRHGTTTAYDMARCRCEHCRCAYARYRAARRADGKDSPRGPRRDGDANGHISRWWFRKRIWRPALDRSALGIQV